MTEQATQSPLPFPPFMLRLCDPKTSGPSIRLTLFPPSTIRLEPPARHSKIRILNSLASILLWALCAGLLCFSDCDWTLASLTFPDRQRTHFFPADLVAHSDQTINWNPELYNTIVVICQPQHLQDTARVLRDFAQRKRIITSQSHQRILSTWKGCANPGSVFKRTTHLNCFRFLDENNIDPFFHDHFRRASISV